ncbi:RNA-directed DNA polymerase, eukaryota, reverse transcriptase zinc-binding domain protein [Tanacetum coccineum]
MFDEEVSVLDSNVGVDEGSDSCNNTRNMGKDVFEEMREKANDEKIMDNQSIMSGMGDGLGKSNKKGCLDGRNDKDAEDSNRKECSNETNDSGMKDKEQDENTRSTSGYGVKSHANVVTKDVKYADNKLNFIPTEVTKEGCEVVIFYEALVDKGSTQWKLTVYGNFVRYVDDGTCMFKFKNESGMNKVLDLGPWMVNNKPLFLRKWDPTIGMEKIELTKIPLWVSMVNVPLEAWSTEGISALASSLGRPSIMDNMTAKRCKLGEGRMDYARVLVEFDVNKGLKVKIEIQYRDKNNNVKGSKHVKVEYAWKPESCSHCNVFGHSHSNYRKRERTAEENNKRFGDKRQVRDGRAFNTGDRDFDTEEIEGMCEKRKELRRGKDMVTYFKRQLEIKKLKEMEDANMDTEDVLENNSEIAKEVNEEEMEGDFNVTLNVEEHSAGGSKINGDMHEFKDCVNDIEVEDINSFCLFCTWIKSPSKPDTSILEKLDRVMISTDFLDKYGDAYTRFLPFLISDHSPMVLHIPNSLDKKKKSFRFSNFVADKPDFLEVVKKEWKCDCDGYSMYKLVKKMERMKALLNNIAWKNGNLFQNVKKLEEDLKMAQVEMEANPNCSTTKEKLSQVLHDYNTVIDDEEKLLAQKAKVKWLSEGDKNTKYFHNVIKRENMAAQFVKHFEKFLGNNGEVDQIESPNDLFTNKISQDKAEFMVREITNKEIKETIFDIRNDKAPGPDGFTATFFKRSWDMVGEDVCDAVKEFFKSNKLLGEVNATLITLVPKVQNTNKVLDFRPVACCNVLYKCISKIITNRIQGCLAEIVSINQSAFVPGRLIQDNLLITQELLKGYNRKNGPRRCALKINIAKAYDTVNWGFLKQSLVHFGFHEKMIDWIMTCVTSAAFSVCVNGERHGYFKNGKGLRQGDPMSPYLFTLVMEVLTLMVQRKVRNNNQFKYHWGCKELKLTQLCFADDLLMLSNRDYKSIEVLKDALMEFSRTSGLIPNMNKNTIFFGSVKEIDKRRILEVMPFAIGKLPMKYLGVPLITKNIGNAECNQLVERVKQKRDGNGIEGRFSTKKVWENFEEDLPEVSWYKVIWFTQGNPMYAFIMWLAIHKRLTTQDRLMECGNGDNLICPLCKKVNDSHEHLFFKCPFSEEVWNEVKAKLKKRNWDNDWTNLVADIAIDGCKTRINSILDRIAIATVIYYIWNERNKRIFTTDQKNAQSLINGIIESLKMQLMSLKLDQVIFGSKRNFAKEVKMVMQRVGVSDSVMPALWVGNVECHEFGLSMRLCVPGSHRYGLSIQQKYICEKVFDLLKYVKGVFGFNLYVKGACWFQPLRDQEQKRGDLAKRRKQLEIRVSPKGPEPDFIKLNRYYHEEVVDTVSPPKVDFATDLFDILAASSADDLWP